MKAKQLAPLAIALLCASAGAQQMYKWVAADGTVSWSDKPPPPTATKVEKKNMAGDSSSTDDLPFALAGAAKKSPVTLYAGANCTPCDLGRKLLHDRGIPFTEKTVSTNDDINQLAKTTGTSSLPVLTIGSAKQQGFSADQWNSALTAANYPATNVMPKTFKNPPATPLAGVKNEVPPADAPATAPTPAPSPAQEPGAQPGFHF